jgi:hypothetical protein
MKPIFRKSLQSLAAISALSLSLTQTASAHCDAMDGPVITEAQRALATGDVTPLLKWVPATDEGEVRAVFDKAVRVRKLGSEAREFADRQFFATLVEVHRASEGAPFTGIKEAGHINPSVSAADAGLATGNVDELVATTTGEVEQGIRQRFAAAVAAKAHAADSVPQGREYVSRYVQYVHYVEGLHAALATTGEHAATDAAAAAEAHAH